MERGQHSSLFSKSLCKFLGSVLSAFDLVEILSFEVSALSNLFMVVVRKLIQKTVLFFYFQWRLHANFVKIHRVCPKKVHPGFGAF